MASSGVVDAFMPSFSLAQSRIELPRPPTVSFTATKRLLMPSTADTRLAPISWKRVPMSPNQSPMPPIAVFTHSTVASHFAVIQSPAAPNAPLMVSHSAMNFGPSVSQFCQT